MRQATADQEARLIWEFLTALEVQKGRVGAQDDDLAWLAWARAEAEEIDPIRNKEPIVQPLKPPDGWVSREPEPRRFGGR